MPGFQWRWFWGILVTRYGFNPDRAWIASPLEFWALHDAQNFDGKPQMDREWLQEFIENHKRKYKGSALNRG